MLGSEDVLFVGRGTGVVPYYRCQMVSFALGCDYVGLAGSPHNLELVCSLKRGGHVLPDFEKYKVVILQQVSGPGWQNFIYHLRKKGIKVIYEVDDYLHGVRKIKSHRNKIAFSKKQLPMFEACMRACDAMICSTEWLANRYRKFNPNTYVCRNSIESKRYAEFSLPQRDTINIGWAGGEGHLESVKAWVPAVERVLDETPKARFISIGLPVAKLLDRPKQCVSLPFIAVENFPGALCNFDIAIAPAGRGGFFQGKSDLRFLETGALGIPLVADPFVYTDIDHEWNGMLAESPEEVYAELAKLVADEELRENIGSSAKSYVTEFRSIENAVDNWENVFVSVYNKRKELV